MTIEDAKQDIISVVQQFVTLKHVGRNWIGLCPFHDEKSGSFTVYKDHFKCYGCDAGGDVFDFLQKIKGITFKEAAKIMDVPVKESKVVTMNITDDGGPLGAKALAFFSDRGIKSNTLTDFNITEKGGEIHFPFIEGEQVVNIKYRGRGKAFRLVSGGKSILYNVNSVAETTFVCEGEIDAMTLSQCGYPAVVSVPNGSQSAKNQTIYLKNCKKIYLAGDMDAPGLKMQNDLAEALGPSRCLMVTWPEGCKDANEVLIKLGEQAIRTAILNAKPCQNDKFWHITNAGRVIINRDDLMSYLHKNGGFSVYYIDPTVYKIVQNDKGFLKEVTTEHIKKFIQLSLKDNKDVLNVFMEKSESLIGKAALEYLPHGQYDFLKDTKDEAFFTFKNGVIRIKQGSFTLHSYAELNKVVWASQVIDFFIKIEEIDVSIVEYYRFISAICLEAPERIDYAITLIGYLLHKYKDPTKAFAVILAEETENQVNGGGTGKGIFFKAISKMLNTVTIDGKAYNPDNSFLFQRVGQDTNLVIMEDVKKTVNFELFYPLITEGFTVQKKYQAEIFIPYEDCPKLGFTTNYSVPAVGNHGKRRQKVFEFSSFFSPSNTPEKHFGHQLFYDWDHKEWTLFYNFMFLCVQAYLEDGLKETAQSETSKRKQLRLAYSDEFAEWWFDFVAIPYNIGRPHMQLTLYRDFLAEAGYSEKDYSQKRFKFALYSGIEESNLSGMFRKNSQAGGGKELTLQNVPDRIPV